MKLAIASIASGSSGNSYIIRSENTALLVDAGVSAKRIKIACEELCPNLKPNAVLLTHEHSDHVAGLSALIKEDLLVYGSEGTLGELEESYRKNCESIVETLKSKQKCISAGECFIVGDINVCAFELSHDAKEPVGYSFEKDGAVISIVTDTGIVTPEISAIIKRSDIIALESNHDESMLRIGPYPYFLKQRILGKLGHLSNETASKALCEVVKYENMCGQEKDRVVLFAHLSEKNNFPQMTTATLDNVFASEGVSKKRISVSILSRKDRSGWFIL